jgi:hypothetical protein
MSGTQDHVHARAYALWRQAGAPESRSDEFWFAAERELEYGESEYETAAVAGSAGTFILAIDAPPALMALRMEGPGQGPADLLTEIIL